MKITHILLAAVLLLCSCGTKSSAPTSKDVCGTDVYGDGDGIISIVSDNYTLTKKDGRLRLKIRLKLEESVDEKVSVYPKIILKDEDGVELISSWNQMEMSSSEKSKFDSFLKSEEGTVKEFVFINEFSSDYFEDALTKSETFSLDKLKFEEDKEDKDVSDEEKDVSNEELEKAIKQTKDVMEVAGDIMEMNKSLMDVAKSLSE